MILTKPTLFGNSLIFLFFTLTLSGCLADVLHLRATFPEWVAAPPQDTQTELIGVGEGSSLDRAKVSALNDIAGKLGTHVSSLVDRDVRQYGDQIKTLAHQLITARIDKIKLIHPRVIKSARYDGNYYVLLSVSKAAMLKDTRSRLNDLDERLKQQWQALRTLSPLRQFVRARKLAPKVDEASGLVMTLQALHEAFLSQPFLERYNGYRQTTDELLATTHFRILTTKAMRPVSEHLLERLSSEEIRSSLETRLRGKGPVIEVTGTIKKGLAFGSKFSHLTTVFELKDARGNTVARREHQATGKSSNDHVSATRNAIEKLIKQWERESILSVIGLNL